MRRKKQIEDKIRELETLFPDNQIRSEMVVGMIESLKWVLVNKK